MLTKRDLEQIRDVVKDEVSAQLKPVNKRLGRIQKDISFIVHDYSNAISGLRKRVEKMEDHLDLPEN